MNILERVKRICKYHDLCESCLLYSAEMDECLFSVTNPCSWGILDIMRALKEEEYEHGFGEVRDADI